MPVDPVLVIGAGPAGLAAAMQLCRQGIQPVVLERNRVGGLLLNANWVENYPGFGEGITGPDLVSLFEGHARGHGVEIAIEEVQTAELIGNTFRIGTNLRELEAQILVAATGTKARQFPSAGLSPGIKRQVYSEVYPLLEETGREILIIGAGDAAFDYALNLAGRNRVTILNRSDKINALPLLIDRVHARSEIDYLENAALISAEEEEKGRIAITIDQRGGSKDLVVDYILTAIGREPDYDFASPSIINHKERLLKDKRLFLIGDLQNGSFRQTSIAAADGVRAAMEISLILEKGKK